MKKFYTTLLLVVASLSMQAQTYTWQQMTSFPSGERHAPVGFEINGLCYFGMGQDSSTTTFDDLWEYDPANDTWTQKASLPSASRLGASSFTLNGVGYVCCGWSSTVTPVSFNDTWKYDPSGNSWTAADTFPGVGRYTACSFVIDTSAYVGTGFGAGGPSWLNDFYRYDPTADSWTNIASCPNALQSASAFSLHGKGYVAGGANSNLLHEVYEYDPDIDQWTLKNGLPQPMGGMFAFVLDGVPFIGCGIVQVTPSIMYTDLVYRYDSTVDLWALADTFPAIPRSSAASVTSGSAAFVFGGNYQLAVIDPFDELWKYAPVISGLDEARRPNLEVYYNTEQRILHLDGNLHGARICMYDLNGRLVMDRPAQDAILMHEAANGILLYSIEDGNGRRIQSGKLLIY